MDIVDQLYSGYGEGAPGGNGPAQDTIEAKGNEYLTKNFPKLSYVKSALLVEPTTPTSPLSSFYVMHRMFVLSSTFALTAVSIAVLVRYAVFNYKTTRQNS